MTAEKAIEILSDVGDINRCCAEDAEALDMAIKALKKQPSEDCRNCKKWNDCPCGKEGHEKRTSTGYSIGDCNDYEPYEDCISREAVLDILKDKWNMFSDANDAIQESIDTIEAIPPVTPTRPTGHWIADVDRWGDIVTTVNGYRCSECCAFNADNDKYCPNCGARMTESEDEDE